MTRSCEYKFVAGSKKGTACGRFLRKGSESYCYAHKKMAPKIPAEEESEEDEIIEEKVIPKKKVKFAPELKRKDPSPKKGQKKSHKVESSDEDDVLIEDDDLIDDEELIQPEPEPEAKQEKQPEQKFAGTRITDNKSYQQVKVIQLKADVDSSDSSSIEELSDDTSTSSGYSTDSD